MQFADDTTAVLSDLNSANALFSLLEEFEKTSGLKLNVKKTEAMWIGSLKSCEDQPLGVKWQPPPQGGGGVLNKVLYGKAPPRGLTPYPFINHFGSKGILLYTFY